MIDFMWPEHFDVATTLNNLEHLYEAQGEYAEVDPLYERALAIREEALGPDLPLVAQTLENYAALLRETGCDTEATGMETRAQATGAKRAKETATN